MNRKTQLTDLKAGQSATVSALSAEGSIRRRLQDMGLIKGTRVECVGVSPLGDPAAYLIRGAVVALRSKDAAFVSLENTGSAAGAYPVPGLSTARPGTVAE